MRTVCPEPLTAREMFDGPPPLPMRKEWLCRLMDTVQVLAVPVRTERHRSQHIAARLAAVESPRTPLEVLILRGLSIEMALRTLPAWARLLLEAHTFPGWPNAAIGNGGPALDRNDPVAKARQIIDREFASRLSARTLAQAVGLPPDVLDRAFHRGLGMSIQQYLIARRIAVATRSLATTDETIQTIAWDVGFRSRAAFSVCFRQHTGFSPTAIRRLSQADGQQ